MPNENDKTPVVPAAPATPAAPDTRDAQIADLEKQVAELKNKLKGKPSTQTVAPAGDYCVLSGKTYEVAGTVSCRYATDEGRKGHIDIDSELVIVKH